MRNEKGSILMMMIPVFAILTISVGISVYNNANETFRSTQSELNEIERKFQDEQNYLDSVYNYTDYNYTDYYDDDYDDYDYDDYNDYDYDDYDY